MAITSPFGQIRRKVSYLYGKWNTNHYGVDLRADVGTPVFAVEGGIVRVADNWLAEGNVVIIDHGYGLFSLYFHLSRLKVKSGEVVGAGQIIALSGQSGAAKGPHLHFEMRLNGIAISPWNFMPEAQIYEVKK
jgi:murein DD-endopeptidase MepM/ murein hydrolase activator NlpD